MDDKGIPYSLLAAYQNAPKAAPPPPPPPTERQWRTGERLTPRQLRTARERLARSEMKLWLEKRIPSSSMEQKTMTDQRRADLKKCFMLLDVKRRGYINHNDVSVAMKALGFSFEAIRRAVLHEREADDDHLTFDEFVSMITRLSSRRKSKPGASILDVGSGVDRIDSPHAFPFMLVVNSYSISRMIDQHHPEQRERRKNEQQERSLLRSITEATAAKAAVSHGHASMEQQRHASRAYEEAIEAKRQNMVITLTVVVHKAMGLRAADYDEKLQIHSSDPYVRLGFCQPEPEQEQSPGAAAHDGTHNAAEVALEAATPRPPARASLAKQPSATNQPSLTKQLSARNASPGTSTPQSKKPLPRSPTPSESNYHEQRTRTIKQNVNPVWNEELKWTLKMSEMPRWDLILQVMDEDKYGEDDFLGRAEVHLGHVTHLTCVTRVTRVTHATHATHATRATHATHVTYATHATHVTYVTYRYRCIWATSLTKGSRRRSSAILGPAPSTTTSYR